MAYICGQIGFIILNKKIRQTQHLKLGVMRYTISHGHHWNTAGFSCHLDPLQHEGAEQNMCSL